MHLATLNGQKVVVKVQRPGLKQLFDIDLKNVRVLAQWLQNVDPKSDGAARDWVAIYDECSRILYQVTTIDYQATGQSMVVLDLNQQPIVPTFLQSVSLPGRLQHCVAVCSSLCTYRVFTERVLRQVATGAQGTLSSPGSTGLTRLTSSWRNSPSNALRGPL